MAISIVSHKTVAWARALASQSVTLSDLTMAEGDLLVLVVGASVTQSDRQIEPPSSDWTRIHATVYQDDTNDINLSSWYRPVPATPPSSVTISSPNPTTSATGSTTITVVVLRGVDSTTPLDVTAVAIGGQNSSHADPPSITPTTAGAFLLFAGVCGHGAATNPTLEVASDVTQISTIQGFSGQTQQGITTLAYKNDWVSGAFDPSAWSYKVNGTVTNNTQGSWGAASMAFRPAAETGGPENITGTLAKSLDAPTVAGTGTTLISGAGATSIAAPAVSASGSAPAQGTATGTFAVTVAASGSQGEVYITGSLAAVLDLSLIGLGNSPVVGALGLGLVAPALTGIATVPAQGQATLAVSLGLAGLAAAPANGLGSGTGFSLGGLTAVGRAPATGALEELLGLSFAGTGLVTGEPSLPILTGTLDEWLGFSLAGQGVAPANGEASLLIAFWMGSAYGRRLQKIIAQEGLWRERSAQVTFLNAPKNGLWQEKEGFGTWA